MLMKFSSLLYCRSLGTFCAGELAIKTNSCWFRPPLITAVRLTVLTDQQEERDGKVQPVHLWNKLIKLADIL